MTTMGSSGNVFAYNLAYERHSEGEIYTMADLSLHGFYQNYNLFESNVIEDVAVADWWGPAGPGNTFLRNKVVDEGISIKDTFKNLQKVLSGSAEKKADKELIEAFKKLSME